MCVSVCVYQVWPGPTAFPDFTNPDTVSWWEECIRDFHANVSLDGLWIVSLISLFHYPVSVFLLHSGVICVSGLIKRVDKAKV